MSRAMYTGSIDVHPLLMEGPKISKFQNRPKRARYRIPARKLHGLLGTGPNQTLEEISRHDITEASPERRTPPAPPPRKISWRHAHNAAPSATHGRAQRHAPSDHRAPSHAAQQAGHRALDFTASARIWQLPHATSGAQQAGHHRANCAASGRDSCATRRPTLATDCAGHGQRSRAMRGQHAGVSRAHARGEDDEAPPCAAAPWPMRCRSFFVSILKN
ncbi:hypothetical protein F511_43466 [Dorcoceras hygrometricum]|uniref:Uncharacterized protein n=1 Tax=Dorcoceras hygrometricum TaxID=472368 RepID=A0A2Z7A7A3_9LAMI|nr:hypothetical protein F511_43466 [Dorcoceras hygrometricum]